MKKNKIIWVIILSILVLNLTGCGSNTDDNTENNTTTTTSKVEPTEDNGVPIYNGIGFTDSGVLKPYEEETYEDAIIITDVNNKLIYEDNGFSITIVGIKQNVKTMFADDKNNMVILFNINNATSDKIMLLDGEFGFKNFIIDNIHYYKVYQWNRPVNLPPNKIQKNAELMISCTEPYDELNLPYDAKKVSFELTYSSADYVTDEVETDYYIYSPDQRDKYDASNKKTIKFVIDMESAGYYKQHEEIYIKENMYKLESNELYDSYLYDLYLVSIDGKYDLYGKIVAVGKDEKLFDKVAVFQVKIQDDEYTAASDSSFSGISTIGRSYFRSNGSFESIPDTIKLGVAKDLYSKKVTSWVTIKKVNEVLEKFNEIHGRESNYVKVLR